MADFDEFVTEATWPLEAARTSLQTGDLLRALTELERIAHDAESEGDDRLRERATAALALCRGVIAMDRSARELEEAHRRTMEVQASERDTMSSALDELLAGATAPNVTISRLGPGLTLGGFTLSLGGGVVELQRPASLSASPQTGRRIRLRLLGRFEVELDGTAMDAWRSKRARQLFAYLALNRHDDLSRHRLMGVFWPEHSEERAENNLSLTVLAIRKLLDEGKGATESIVRFRAPSYAIEASELWLDTEAFDDAVTRATHYEALRDDEAAATALDEALGLYAGDLLPADVYEDWTVELRQRLQDVHTDALQRRGQLARNAGDFDTSIELNRRLLTRDPAFEPAHRQLMLDYLATGQRSRAAAQMATCKEALERHLGVEPDDATKAVFRRVTA
jgi:DNA-binding SARP family transcriptional activator